MNTVPVFTIADLSGKAKEKALRWAFEHFSCPDYALEYEKDMLTRALDAFGFRYASISYSVGYCKSDFAKVEHDGFKYKPGGLAFVRDNIPELYGVFFDVYMENRKVFFSYYNAVYGWFEHASGAIYLEDGFYNAMKNLNRAIYYFLRNSLDYYFSDDFIMGEIDNACPLFTSDGHFVIYGECDESV